MYSNQGLRPFFCFCIPKSIPTEFGLDSSADAFSFFLTELAERLAPALPRAELSSSITKLPRFKTKNSWGRSQKSLIRHPTPRAPPTLWKTRFGLSTSISDERLPKGEASNRYVPRSSRISKARHKWRGPTGVHMFFSVKARNVRLPSWCNR